MAQNKAWGNVRKLLKLRMQSECSRAGKGEGGIHQAAAFFC
jgi:hypothetical protein